MRPRFLAPGESSAGIGIDVCPGPTFTTLLFFVFLSLAGPAVTEEVAVELGEETEVGMLDAESSSSSTLSSLSGVGVTVGVEVGVGDRAETATVLTAAAEEAITPAAVAAAVVEEADRSPLAFLVGVPVFFMGSSFSRLSSRCLDDDRV